MNYKCYSNICVECSNFLNCLVCDDEYELDDQSLCVEKTEIKTRKTSNLAIGTYLVIGIASLTSISSMKPDSALWGVFNIIQILRSILLLEVELPETLKLYL